MKKVITLILASFCLIIFSNSSNVFGQAWTAKQVPDFIERSNGIGELVKMDKSDTGANCIFVFKMPVYIEKPASKKLTISAGAEPINGVIISEVQYDEKFRMLGFNSFIMENPGIDLAEFEVYDTYRKSIGITHEQLLTFDQLFKQFPEIGVEDVVDNIENYRTQKYYTSELTSNLVGKITGFVCTEHSIKTSNDDSEEKPKKGIMNKLSSLNEKLAGTTNHVSSLPSFNDTQLTNLDWKESYNGGDGKKDYWIVQHHDSDPKTGHSVAFNMHRGKQFDSRFDREIAIYNKDGDILIQQAYKTDLPWQWGDFESYYSYEDGLATLLKTIAIDEQTGSSKKKFPNANRLERKLIIVDVQNPNVSEFVFELPDLTFQKNQTFIGEDFTWIVGGDEYQRNNYFFAAGLVGSNKYTIKPDKFAEAVGGSVTLAEYKYLGGEINGANGFLLFVHASNAKQMVITELENGEIKWSKSFVADIEKLEGIIETRVFVHTFEDRTIIELSYLFPGRDGENRENAFYEIDNMEIKGLNNISNLSFNSFTPKASFGHKVGLSLFDGDLFWLGRRSFKEGSKYFLLTTNGLVDN